MKKIFLLISLVLNFVVVFGQKMDFTSIDEFFKITRLLEQGDDISEEQWRKFENTRGYRAFAERDDKFLIQTIESSMQLAFGKNGNNEGNTVPLDEPISDSPTLEGMILTNYLDIKQNYADLKSFRENYDFNALHTNAIRRLSTFLETSIEPDFQFKPIYFVFITPDGQDREDALYIDLNMVYKLSEDARVDFIAHEFFHNIRRLFENHNFNHKNDLNFMLDMIQNEGIADQIDKSRGYDYYFSVVNKSSISETMIQLYYQAETDLEKIHNIILEYAEDKLSEDEMVDKLLEVYKYNGHAIGFYMSSQIVKAGLKKEMIKNFYNPYKFYELYNIAAKTNGTFALTDEFLDFVRKRSVEYYRERISDSY